VISLLFSLAFQALNPISCTAEGWPALICAARWTASAVKARFGSQGPPSLGRRYNGRRSYVAHRQVVQVAQQPSLGVREGFGQVLLHRRQAREADHHGLFGHLGELLDQRENRGEFGWFKVLDFIDRDARPRRPTAPVSNQVGDGLDERLGDRQLACGASSGSSVHLHVEFLFLFGPRGTRCCQICREFARRPSVGCGFASRGRRNGSPDDTSTLTVAHPAIATLRVMVSNSEVLPRHLASTL